MITIIHLENFGIGPVEPDRSVSDDEIAKVVVARQEDIHDDSIVCVDERKSTGGNQPVRRKVAVGAGMSGFVGAVLAGWHLLGEQGDRTANQTFEFVASALAERGVTLGGHIDSHTDMSDPALSKTNCGATDGAPQANQRIAEIGAEILGPKVAALMGDDFSDDIYDKIIKKAQQLEETKFFSSWDPIRVIKFLQENSTVVEVLDGTDDAFSDRHGHYAQAVNFNTIAGKSNNRDESEIPFFQLDKEAVDVIADKLGRNDDEKRHMRHAIYAYNVAIVYGLTKNQRLTIL